MGSVTAALAAFFRRHAPVPPGGLLVVAVSGGPDSLALLHALHALRGELRLRLHAAHLDHTLRGAQSAAEAAFVAETARAWGITATVASADVRALVREHRLNLHAAARAARYGLLARVAAEMGAHAVATAHHADDQAETVLAHLLRGAGPEGLAGMSAVVPYAEWSRATLDVRTLNVERSAAPTLNVAGSTVQRSTFNGQPPLIRPLLSVTRAAIEAYCAANGLEPRRVPSNEDRRYARTRIRRDLLPRLI
ncbi:MAG TPA: tRNA lysidine(34) synthetase TilS, partial [Roseiflexaceae bacterium]|nr:tRNA lysidine(34) synthetase TilS [Roseiflexaceae bacterium]